MSSYNQYTDPELFHLIAKGDENAFTELFHRFTPRVLPTVLKLTKNQYQAEEIIQETFLRIWIDRQNLVNIENPSGWIFRIASNISISWLRQQSNRRRLLQTVETRETEQAEPLEAKELSLIIHRAVDTLPEKRKQIYRLSRETGLSHQQIAEQLGISPNTVKNQIGIALKSIQEFINKETGLSISTIILLLSMEIF